MVDLQGSADDGLPDERLSAALLDWVSADEERQVEHLAEVAAAFCAARVYVPAVTGERGRLGLVALRRGDGMTAIPAFTGVQRLVDWRADARPLPHEGGSLAELARAEGYAVIVVDIEGPVTATLPVDVLAAGDLPG